MPAFTPHYERIMNDIREQIREGELRPGDKLPSTADLAERYGVSRGTVREAVNRLLAVAVLRGHQGLGVYVAEKPPNG